MDPTFPNKVTIIFPATTNYLTKPYSDELVNATITFGLFRAQNNLDGNPFNLKYGFCKKSLWKNATLHKKVPVLNESLHLKKLYVMIH